MSMPGEAPLKTPLHGWHQAHNGRMVEFGGWSMPVQYRTIIEEHQAVRHRLGLFDVGHMGRLLFSGPDARGWLEYATTNHVARLKPGQIQYSLMCNGGGGVVDDILVYALPEGQYGMVCNASNRAAVVAELERLRGHRDATLADMTLQNTMIAVQGPRALEALDRVVAGPLAETKYYRWVEATALGRPVSVSRTGYTGEDGFEVIVPNDLAEPFWEAVLAAGREFEALPCGLGARDTLRFEAGMPLYGHELTETTNPYAAGLGWVVKLDKGDFVGRDALRRFHSHPGQARVGLALEGKRIARQGCVVLRDGKAIGTVTSGTFAPTLGRSLAMALVEPSAAGVGTPLAVDVRGHAEAAEVVPLPFYRRQGAAKTAASAS
jgi:aminomethyltransferase